MAAAAQLVREALAAGGPERIAILGGARGTNEDAFAWASLADAIGVASRDAQLGDGLPAALLALPRATIEEATTAATVVLLAPDLKEELPILHLRLRHAAEQRTVKIIELSPRGDRSDEARVADHPDRGRRGGGDRDRPRRSRDRRPAAGRSRRRRGRPAEPRRVLRCRGDRAARRPRRLPGCDGAAGVAARQRRRCAAARSRARSRWARCRRHPHGRCGRPARSAGAARRRPAERLPGCRPRPPGARRCAPGDRGRHVPDRLQRDRRRGPRARPRTERSRARRRTSRVASPRSTRRSRSPGPPGRIG